MMKTRRIWSRRCGWDKSHKTADQCSHSSHQWVTTLTSQHNAWLLRLEKAESRTRHSLVSRHCQSSVVSRHFTRQQSHSLCADSTTVSLTVRFHHLVVSLFSLTRVRSDRFLISPSCLLVVGLVGLRAREKELDWTIHLKAHSNPILNPSPQFVPLGLKDRTFRSDHQLEAHLNHPMKSIRNSNRKLKRNQIWQRKWKWKWRWKWKMLVSIHHLEEEREESS